MGSRVAQEDHMVKVEATAARNGFSDLINKVRYGSDRVLIERRGKDVAGLLSIQDLRLLEILEDQIDIEAARKGLANPKNKVRGPLEQVKKRVGVESSGVAYTVEVPNTAREELGK